MELKAKDFYRAECRDTLTQEGLFSLFQFYQPVIGRNAAALYLTLYSESKTQRTQESHSKLLSLMDMNIDDLERARIHLEEFLLLRSFVQEQESRTSYIYSLNLPLSRENFISSGELLGRFVKAIGQKQAELAVSRLQTDAVSHSNYREVTRVISHLPARAEYENGLVLNKVKPRVRFDSENEEINFDYDLFFQTTSTLVFPAELRTTENLRLIGRLATVHGLSPDQMRVNVSKCIDLETMRFDDEKLKVLCARSKPEIIQAEDPYKLPPVSFLQARQNGAEVSMGDRKILEDLSLKMHFPPEVINVMIEYILKQSQNRLVRSFVEMVAGEWARDGIRTKEQAVAATRKRIQNRKYSGRQNVLPSYREKSAEENEEAMSESESRELEELMKKMGGGHE